MEDRKNINKSEERWNELDNRETCYQHLICEFTSNPFLFVMDFKEKRRKNYFKCSYVTFGLILLQEIGSFVVLSQLVLQVPP